VVSATDPHRRNLGFLDPGRFSDIIIKEEVRLSL
jgi:hypothetical protein